MESPHQLFRQILAATGDRPAAIRAIRERFGLGLAQAKVVMLQAEGTPESQAAYREWVTGWSGGTEAEWLASNDGKALAKRWGSRFSERKARLLMLACCERHGHLLTEPALRDAAEALAAHYADPLGAERPFDEQDTRAQYSRVDAFTYRDDIAGGEPGFLFYLACGLKVAVKPTAMAAADEYALPLVVDCMASILGGIPEPAAEERAQQAVLVREVLGNPYRLVFIRPEWRTSAALELAAEMYRSRDFSAMPILADTLQDAGCDDAELLSHCRGPGPHVRGCWAVDGVLGKGSI